MTDPRDEMSDLERDTAISVVGLYLGSLSKRELECVNIAARAGVVCISYAGFAGLMGLGKVVMNDDFAQQGVVLE